MLGLYSLVYGWDLGVYARTSFEVNAIVDAEGNNLGHVWSKTRPLADESARCRKGELATYDSTVVAGEDRKLKVRLNPVRSPGLNDSRNAAYQYQLELLHLTLNSTGRLTSMFDPSSLECSVETNLHGFRIYDFHI